MHNLLTRLLGKRGIDDPNKLSEEEKSWFDQRQAILTKEELTIEDLEKFCKMQLDVIEGKWQDLAVPNDKKAELIPYHTCYKLILKVCQAPHTARAAVEQEINQLLNI